MCGGCDGARISGLYGRGGRAGGRIQMMINSVDVSDPTRNLQPMNGPDYVGMVDGHMLPRRGRA